MKKNVLAALLPILAETAVIFRFCRVLPLTAKLVIIAIFAVIWLGRKVVARIASQKLCRLPALEPFLWEDAGDGARTFSNDKMQYLANAAIIILFAGIPMLIYGICAWVSGLWAGLVEDFILFKGDITGLRGTGRIIFAVAELVVTISAIGSGFICWWQYHRCEWSGHMALFAGGLVFAFWRILSWFYFSVGFSGAIGELITLALLIGAIVVIKKIRARRRG